MVKEVGVGAGEEGGDVAGEGDRFATWALKTSNTMMEQTMMEQERLLRK